MDAPLPSGQRPDCAKVSVVDAVMTAAVLLAFTARFLGLFLCQWTGRSFPQPDCWEQCCCRTSGHRREWGAWGESKLPAGGLPRSPGTRCSLSRWSARCQAPCVTAPALCTSRHGGEDTLKVQVAVCPRRRLQCPAGAQPTGESTQCVHSEDMCCSGTLKPIVRRVCVSLETAVPLLSEGRRLTEQHGWGK